MSTVVTVMNMKGGVGKTTICLNVGGIMAVYKITGERKKVLLIDYDPQFNLSQATLQPSRYFRLEEKECTSLRILQDARKTIDP